MFDMKKLYRVWHTNLNRTIEQALTNGRACIIQASSRRWDITLGPKAALLPLPSQSLSHPSCTIFMKINFAYLLTSYEWNHTAGTSFIRVTCTRKTGGEGWEGGEFTYVIVCIWNESRRVSTRFYGWQNPLYESHSLLNFHLDEHQDYFLLALLN